MIAGYAANAVRAAEEPLLALGPPGALMAQASFALATEVIRELHARGSGISGTRVLTLVGGGNNGGDALHASAMLARRGASVTAALLTARPHAEGAAAARAAGVELCAFAGPPDVVGRVAPSGRPEHGPSLALTRLVALARGADVWIDGLAGIGASGALREPLAGAARALEALRDASPIEPLVVAVDVPSGIGVDDGALPGPALTADVTVAMGAYKPGLLLPPAAALAGRVALVDLGLDAALRAGVPTACQLQNADVADLWPVPTATMHKYSRGVLGLVAGSVAYPGAGVLAVGGATGTGVGMIRYLGEAAVLRLVHATHPEVVGAPGRVQAWALGSGVDPADAPTMTALAGALRAALADGLPAVLDAGALALAWPAHPQALAGPLTPVVVLTPHAGELARLLTERGVRTGSGRAVERADVEAEPGAWTRRAARETGATVLLKGSTTIVAAPEGPLFAQADATAWLAIAGAGDVLVGVLGALLAGRSDDVRSDPALAARLAAAAALVHGRAARRAAHHPPPPPPSLPSPRRALREWAVGGPIAAGDVARALPAAIAGILAGLD